jgi:uncharacterized protein YndB with AHSA1/START domain
MVMTERNADRRTDTVSQVIEASPGRIYEALTDRAALETWLPPAGMSGRFLAFDLRDGGGYRLELTYLNPDDATAAKSTDDSDIVDVRIVELVPNERVVQAVDFDSDDPAFCGRMTMTWRLDACGDGTEVTIVAEQVPPGIRAEDHLVGMQSSLEHLEHFLAE